MKPHNEIVYPIGSKVIVRSDYKNTNDTSRDGTVTVIGHSVNKSPDGDFIDNILRFENGNEEYFANWEIDCLEE